MSIPIPRFPTATQATVNTFNQTYAIVIAYVDANQQLYVQDSQGENLLPVQVEAGSAAFSALAGGTNTTAAMIVGTGASLAVSGTGTITATTSTTQSPGNSTTKIATTAFTTLAVGVETTRAEAAEALLAPIASPTFTGTVTLPILVESATLSPTSAATAGVTGQIAWDASKIYVCTAGGIAGAATWKAAALSAV